MVTHKKRTKIGFPSNFFIFLIGWPVYYIIYLFVKHLRKCILIMMRKIIVMMMINHNFLKSVMLFFIHIFISHTLFKLYSIINNKSIK